MLILGLDPGIAITGFGLIRVTDENPSPIIVDYGVINATAEGKTSSRLVYLYEQLSALLDKYQPDYCAVEKLFFKQNVTTGMRVSEARGVIALCLAQKHYPMAELSPNEVKMAITSYGHASKEQVQEMLRVLLNIDFIPKPDDAADGLAIALCHLSTLRFELLIKSGE
ncbi:MAG: crossover junction endodeoxyribonuclease RuvC [Anaerolineaceae bacterium]|nr:crossover junction endodeoxyribonuclease RuvC [Anaerolineaceae bacterium]